jgi:hypothetical protein
MGWSLLEKTIDPVCGKRINPVKAGIAADSQGTLILISAVGSVGRRFRTHPRNLTRGGINFVSLQRLVESLSAAVRDRATQGKPPCCQ